MGLRVLITNVTLAGRTGTEVYVRDLALELLRQGHHPAVFIAGDRFGPIGAELRAAGVRVASNLLTLRGFEPDVIHGHHTRAVVGAAHRFPRAPIIFICHDHRAPWDTLPFVRGIRRWFAVSELCRQRLIRDGIADATAKLLLNFVDTRRFQPRPPLPPHPARALVLSHTARADTHLPAVTEACRRLRLPLDVVGSGSGKPVNAPERILGRYDVVFAKAKAAMEAMAIGAAVVLCDYGGVGPMVTTANFDPLRPHNFGFRVLSEPLAPEPLVREIERYDAHDAARVRDRIRSEAALEPFVTALVGTYRAVIDEGEDAGPPFAGGAHLLRHVFVARDALALRLVSSAEGTGRLARLLASMPGMPRLVAASRSSLGEP